MRESDRVGWAYEVHSPETKNPIEPLALNDLYNRTMIGINEHHQLHFGRELNERTFDLGMAGRLQVSDMGWLGAPVAGPFARFYSGNVAQARDCPSVVKMLAERALPEPGVVHEHFKRHHSFEARLAALSGALGVDLSLGAMVVGHGQAEYQGVVFTPSIM